MTAPVPQAAVDAQRVLLDHAYIARPIEPGESKRAACSCGWRSEPSPLPIHDHAAHVAAAVVAAVRGPIRAEALREAAEALDVEGHHWSGRPALGYFNAADDLRDRADRIEAQ